MRHGSLGISSDDVTVAICGYFIVTLDQGSSIFCTKCFEAAGFHSSQIGATVNN